MATGMTCVCPTECGGSFLILKGNQLAWLQRSCSRTSLDRPLPPDPIRPAPLQGREGPNSLASIYPQFTYFLQPNI